MGVSRRQTRIRRDLRTGAGLGWFTVLATTFISFAFIGIEAIGVEIEDPFGQDPNDLPLEGICIGVEAHLVNLYNQNDLLEVMGLNLDTKII